MKISVRQYAQLIYDLEKDSPMGKRAEVLAHLATFVRKNKDVRKLDKILKKYVELKKEKEGRKEGYILTMEKIENEKVEEIKKIMGKKVSIDPEKLDISVRVDKNIEGGIVIRIENEIWDGSLKTKIERLKAAILL